MATHVVPTAIVVEVLRDDNCKNWRACMESYLMAQGLWDVIEPPPVESQEVALLVQLNRNLAQRNAAALHAIQISCAPHILSKIRNQKSAKEAWEFLEGLLRSQRVYLEENPEPILNNQFLLELHQYAYQGNWSAMESILQNHPDPNLICQQTLPTFRTALHVATLAGHVKIVEELVKLMTEESLGMQDCFGNTALFYAAIVGITKMAEIMINKNKRLITIVNKEGYLPIVQACILNHKDMTHYLYRVILESKHDLASQEYSRHGSLLLQYSIESQMFDIAFDLLHFFPSLATAKDAVESNALILLSICPEAFSSFEGLVFWKRWIYSCICVESLPASDEIQSQNGQKNTMLQVLSRLNGLATYLLKLLGFKQIYELKLIHNQNLELLHIICEHLAKVEVANYKANGVYEALQYAVENGIVEIVTELINVNSDLMTTTDKNLRNLFLSSIAHRQEKIFNLFYGIEAIKADFFSSTKDKFGDTMLHLAGKLSSSSRLARISGAALQMQRELQWYKEVENVVNPKVKEDENEFSETPDVIFTRDHKHLKIEGEKWMKDTATSCTVVGALIITIMFTAVFTVPGGNFQDSGLPIFLHEKAFSTFIISDAISLFASSTSVLMFLGILTSRYSEQDFLRSLPTKLIIGLSTLFISIATMMVSFCAALVIMLDGKLHIVMPIVFLAGIPVTLFMLLQFPLLVEIFLSTYGPGIFKRKTKCLY